MATQTRNLFQHLPPPAECLALFIATLEIVPFGVMGLRNPSFFADGYGLPITSSSDASSASAKRSSAVREQDQQTKKALVAAIAARNIQNGILLATFGLLMTSKSHASALSTSDGWAYQEDAAAFARWRALGTASRRRRAIEYNNSHHSEHAQCSHPGHVHFKFQFTMSCEHTILQLDSSPFAELAGYEQPNTATRSAAEATSGRALKTAVSQPTQTYPAPLVLPHDELNYEPEYPPQSTRNWLNEEERNKVLPGAGRDTLYVVRVPEIEQCVSTMSDWTQPSDAEVEEDVIASPAAHLFVSYLKAFYHDMPVHQLDTPLKWTSWGAQPKSNKQRKRSSSLPKYVGLAHNDTCTRIRVRIPPDSAFPAQLNLEDILDTAIELLPDDAYALVLLVNHDIYENDNDDFCCGRAYGGSRVAVVQSARYNPLLDAKANIQRDHMWPLSHCKGFVDGLCAVEDVKAKAPSKKQKEASKEGAMRAAVDSAATYDAKLTQHEFQGLWFSRLARTVSHELGHCFGMDHCVYYACNMQGTSSMHEDVRQPPYLCPVCEAKIAHAIAGELRGGKSDEKEAWIGQRCDALKTFCGLLEEKGMGSAMWSGLDGWLGERMKGL
ncbi:zinc ion binding [Stemphylium lycopersici]|uniref:Zinc ion binding n=1 Tax=Stemphylium lycopersici TaxID=183478 RepID=A0A364MYA9_STELY|nr:zinc ion binding [Stemphylium lycopersici]